MNKDVLKIHVPLMGSFSLLGSYIKEYNNGHREKRVEFTVDRIHDGINITDEIKTLAYQFDLNEKDINVKMVFKVPVGGKHYKIIGNGGTVIGCCYEHGKKDVLSEEPGVTFEEVDVMKCECIKNYLPTE